MRNFITRYSCASSIAILALASSCSQIKETTSKLAEIWASHDDPLRLGTGYERNFDRLPTRSTLEITPWADSYWPSYVGGLAARWGISTSDSQYAWNYQTYSYEQLRNMSQSQLAKLSPAEKLDIVNNNFSYPLLAQERNRTSPNAARWEGICHGWAPSSLLFAEPTPIVYRAANGLNIPFGSSDIKALLSYNQGQVSPGATKFLGLRCDVDLREHPERANDPDCKGVNAGAFHLVLTNFIAFKKQGFVADVVRDLQVWNHPFYAYSYNVTGEREGASPGAAPGTVKEINIHAVARYRVESSPTWGRTNNIQNYSMDRSYYYTLELNAGNQIIGGTWQQSDQPDFLWTQGQGTFRDYFAVVEDIYGQATQGVQPTPRPTLTPVPSVTPVPTITPVPTVTAVPTITPVPTINPSPTGTPIPPIGPLPTLPPNSPFTSAWVEIRHIQTNSCFSVAGSSNYPGALIVLSACRGDRNQQFWMYPDNGLMRIMGSNLCVSVNSNGDLIQDICRVTVTQQFAFTDASRGGYVIRAIDAPNACVTISGNGQMYLTTCANLPSQIMWVRDYRDPAPNFTR